MEMATIKTFVGLVKCLVGERVLSAKLQFQAQGPRGRRSETAPESCPLFPRVSWLLSTHRRISIYFQVFWCTPIVPALGVESRCISLSLRLALYTQQVSQQPKLHNKTLPKKNIRCVYSVDRHLYRLFILSSGYFCIVQISVVLQALL